MKSPHRAHIERERERERERGSISRAPFNYLPEFLVNGTPMILKNGATM